MIKTISAASLALLLAAGAAPAFAQSSPQSWTGGYVGLYGGAMQNNDDEDEKLGFDRDLDGQYGQTVSTVAGADAFSPGFCDGAAKGVSAASGCDDDATGVEGGIRAGYDYQFGSFVVGALAEIGATDVDDTVTGFSTTPAAYQFTRNLEYLAAARLRAGYAYGPALLYATGGYASGKIENRFFSTNSVNSFTAQVDEDGNADGWQAGGGVEYAVAPHLTLTGEYLYTSLEPGDFVVRVGQGAAPATNPFILPPNTTGTDMIRSNGRFGVHAIRIGMNYRF